MRVVFTHHFTNRAGGFAEFLFSRVPALKHAVEHPSVNGLEAIAGIGESSPDDDGHGVVDVRIFHFSVERMVQDNLTGSSRSVIDGFFFRCQGWSPPLRGAQ